MESRQTPKIVCRDCQELGTKKLTGYGTELLDLFENHYCGRCFAFCCEKHISRTSKLCMLCTAETKKPKIALCFYSDEEHDTVRISDDRASSDDDDIVFIEHYFYSASDTSL